MAHPVSSRTTPPAPARTQHSSIPTLARVHSTAAPRSLLLLRLAHERAHLLALLLCAQVCAELRVHARRVSSLVFALKSSPLTAGNHGSFSGVCEGGNTAQATRRPSPTPHTKVVAWSVPREPTRKERDSIRTFFLHSLSARLSLPTFSSSVTRFSYGARPATSRMISRTNFTRLLARCTPAAPPFQREAAAALIAPEHDPRRASFLCCRRHCGAWPMYCRQLLFSQVLHAAARAAQRRLPLRCLSPACPTVP